jgi:hypothetical protein
MDCIDRRELLTLMLGAAAAATIGPALDVQVAEAAPLPLSAGRPEDSADVIHQVQSGPPPHRRPPHRGPRRRGRGWGFGPNRRWHCWWHKGRRVCGWRRW